MVYNEEELNNLKKERINLLEDNVADHPRGTKIFRLSRFILYILVILSVTFFVFSYQVIFTGTSIAKVFHGKLSFFKQLTTLAGDKGVIKGENEDRINVLLLGMGGKGHDGPYLTDTMILASIQPSTQRVAMISIPRDLLVEIPGYGWWKINNANAFGEQKTPEEGANLAKEVVEKTFDIPVHYYVRADFSGFEQLIDQVDGVKVNVDNSFIDFQFPTDDYKYQVVSFDKGLQTMDGTMALNFVRSRHGNNGEGSDFARSLRQQKVIQALKERLLSYNILLNPKKITQITDNLASHLATDLELAEAVKLAKMLKNVDSSKIINKNMDDGPGGLLYANMVNGAYVLQPKGDDFAVIRDMIKNVFDTNTAPQKTTAEPEKPIERLAKMEIANGTTIAGLASRISTELKNSGYRINKIGNAETQDYEKTAIYKLTKDELPETSAFLEKKFNLKVNNNNIPSWIIESAAPDLDFFIILGNDITNSSSE